MMATDMAYPREADLHRLFDRSPVGMYRSTADGRFVYVNPALVAMLGYRTVDEVLALSLARDVYVDADVRGPLVERYLGLGLVDGVEVRWRTRGGEIRHVRIYGYGVHDELGDGFEATAVDVTELHRAERALGAQRAETQRRADAMRLVLEQVPGLIWSTDHELRVTSAEGTALRGLMRGQRREGGPRTLYQHFGTQDDAFPIIAQHHAALGGETVHFEADEGDRTYATTIAPQHDGDGAIIGTIGTAIDVTTVRKLERRLADAQRAESLGVMAGGLAHDFNNLLVAMLGNADLALRELAGGPGTAAVENIRTTALRAAELTSQLLASAGGGPRVVDDVDLAPIVDEMLALLGANLAPRAAITVELARDLPAVRADAAQLRQVVLNLVTNARDALPETGGHVVVRTSVVRHDGRAGDDDVIVPPRPGTYVAFEVEDDGCGIDATTRRRMFEPFYTTKPSGHGLGLAAVHGILRSHGGGLRVSSELGIGTRFQVLWPAGARRVRAVTNRLADGTLPPPVQRDRFTDARFADGSRPGIRALPPATPRPVEPEGSHRLARLGSEGGRRTVLVVDDEAFVRDVTCRMLEDIGYRTLDAPDGHAAIAVACDPANCIDAVILDLTMPGLGGRSVLAALRDSRPDLPVILCSGYDRDPAAADDAAGFLRKPFHFDALEELLLRVVPD
jgi:two-component system cell cycle sensor histidine kinase/response regulator CckA